MTAEELKAAVREYADEHLPGWKEATVMVSATLHIGVRPTAEEEAIAAGLRARRELFLKKAFPPNEGRSGLPESAGPSTDLPPA